MKTSVIDGTKVVWTMNLLLDVGMYTGLIWPKPISKPWTESISKQQFRYQLEIYFVGFKSDSNKRTQIQFQNQV